MDKEEYKGVSDYLDRTMDLEELAGDLKALVADRLQNSIPDDQKIMMDLASQVEKLSREMEELRKRVDTRMQETAPSGEEQMQEIRSELAEIRQLLAKRPEAVREERPERESTWLEEREDALPAKALPARKMRKIEEEEEDKKKQTVLSIIGNVLFYVVIVGIVIGAFLVKSGSGGQPTMIAGYSAFTVLSSSMEDTYPKGSLIITKSVDPKELEIGDDITFMVSATSSITHRIIGITEEYLDTGKRAFETQGTMNENPDKDPVAAANVVGEVIFCSKSLGAAASFVSKNWPLLLFFIAVLSALTAFLKWNFSQEDEPEEQTTKRKKQKNGVKKEGGKKHDKQKENRSRNRSSGSSSRSGNGRNVRVAKHQSDRTE